MTAIYVVTATFMHEGNPAKVGDTLTLEEEYAERLIRAGVVEPYVPPEAREEVTKTYIVLQPVSHMGKIYSPGETIDLGEHSGQLLVDAEHLVEQAKTSDEDAPARESKKKSRSSSSSKAEE